MKWRHFWHRRKGWDSKQVLQENRVYEKSMNIKLFISLDRGHYFLYYTETSSDTDLFSLPSQWSLQSIRLWKYTLSFKVIVKPMPDLLSGPMLSLNGKLGSLGTAILHTRGFGKLWISPRDRCMKHASS